MTVNNNDNISTIIVNNVSLHMFNGQYILCLILISLIHILNKRFIFKSYIYKNLFSAIIHQIKIIK
jgi:hypothetical protein